MDNLQVIEIYIIIFLIIYIVLRRQLEFSGPLVYKKTHKAIEFIWNTGQRYRKAIAIISDIGIIIGFVGMILSLLFLVNGLKHVFIFKEKPVATVAPVIPGIKVSGTPYIPLFEGLLILSSVVIIHEFAHGFVAAAEGLKPKSLWLFIFLIFPGAGVELDEGRIARLPTRKKLRIYAVGSFANILSAFVVMFLLLPIFTFIIGKVTQPIDGVLIDGVTDGYPAKKCGLMRGDIIWKINNTRIRNATDFIQFLNTTKPGDLIYIETQRGVFRLVLSRHPLHHERGYLGVMINLWAVQLKPKFASLLGIDPVALSSAILYILEIARLFIMIHISIGMINLLPLFPLDGGRMMVDLLIDLEERWHGFPGELIARFVSSISLFIFLLNLLGPIIYRLKLV